jgi:hypothetical protein
MHTFHSTINSNNMKTYILTLFTFFAFLISNAQDSKFIISSSFNFQNSTSESENQKYSSNYFQITPRFMYKINNNWGIGILYALSKNTTEGGSNSKITGNQFGGFLQYNLIDKTKFQLFSELDGRYTTQKSKNEPDYYSFKGVVSGIHTGIRYNFYKRLGAELRLNNIISYSTVKHESDNKSSNFRFLDNPFQQISYGLNLSF